ncbi:MAG TPA: SDR family NAD(P)-dependent oxidoreductase [Polyangia bacterium]|nr:SDR family NAD(P)-dependent oxidoreductase [Polyangia bacterium]
MTVARDPAAKLRGRVAVVTGASRGIGRAIAEALAGAGATVAGCSLHGAESTVRCDVRSPSDVARFARQVETQHGAADILINNAGTVARATLGSLEEAAWDEVIGSNLKGTYLVSRAFLPGMLARGSGRIVNISSISGRQGTAGLTAYCAAKHGVVGFTRALAEEVRGAGIAVNAVCPGSVDTDMLRIGMPGAKPQMSPEDVAGVVLYLVAEAPPALTGSCVDVFG